MVAAVALEGALLAAAPGRSLSEDYALSVDGRPVDVVRVPVPENCLSSTNRQPYSFDRVRDITAQTAFAAARDGSGYELAVPLSLVSLKLRKGMTFKGDIGVLRGDEGATLARSYWSNKATAIVSDVPSEAELRPANWGEIKVEVVK